jgi:hypothetical protein
MKQYGTARLTAPSVPRASATTRPRSICAATARQPADWPADSNLGWKGADKYVATVPQIFDLWQDPQERYDIFMNNYTEHNWTLLSISAAIKDLMKTTCSIRRASNKEQVILDRSHLSSMSGSNLCATPSPQRESISRCRPATDFRAGARQGSSFHREDQVKQLLLLGASLLAVSACAPPSSPPAVAGQPLRPVSYASGSSTSTTPTFDGTFTGLTVQKVAGGAITPGGGAGSANRPNYTASSLPPVTISNGLAQFPAIDLTFQGYVTPKVN